MTKDEILSQLKLIMGSTTMVDAKSKVRDLIKSLSVEQWKPVKGYEGMYEISNLGRVRSLWGKEPKIRKNQVDENGEFCVLYKRHQIDDLVEEAFGTDVLIDRIVMDVEMSI